MWWNHSLRIIIAFEGTTCDYLRMKEIFVRLTMVRLTMVRLKMVLFDGGNVSLKMDRC